jgi:predicted nucleotidyltransferase component of viral defense system
MYKEVYLKQVQLLLKCLLSIRENPYFALKGGTAINLFLSDLPRLSVDIDLTYYPFDNRDVSLNNIQAELKNMGAMVKANYPNFTIKDHYTEANRYLTKISVFDGSTIVKIEPNFIMRGTLYPIEYRSLCKEVSTRFGVFIDKIPTLSKAEIYAGKICAALDRQHPRDLFDIKILFDNGGITEEIRKAFVIYLACGPRPMHELLKPNLLEINQAFYDEFLYMTNYHMEIDELLQAREKLIKTINATLTQNEKRFLISVKQGTPNYQLMEFEHLDKLPALAWKIININRMHSEKKDIMLRKLMDALGV